jgi:hypothetical protein
VSLGRDPAGTGAQSLAHLARGAVGAVGGSEVLARDLALGHGLIRRQVERVVGIAPGIVSRQNGAHGFANDDLDAVAETEVVRVARDAGELRDPLHAGERGIVEIRKTLRWALVRIGVGHACAPCSAKKSGCSTRRRRVMSAFTMIHFALTSVCRDRRTAGSLEFCPFM